MRAASPLRYPGGKWRLAPFFECLVVANGLSGGEYVEPYAGGASLALSLLIKGTVSRIHLNDLDPALYSFWWSVLNRPDEFVRLLRRTPVNIVEWQRQRRIYSTGAAATRLALGFACFYLNRTNHSGIMNGGVIGGKLQRGPWRIDARFNKVELERRITIITRLQDRIRIYHQDALAFLAGHPFGRKSLVYLDPPYFRPGKALYLNAYTPSDHEQVHSRIEKCSLRWIVSYDDVPPIRRLYKCHPSRQFTLLHTARSIHLGREVMFFSRNIKIPGLPGRKPVNHLSGRVQ
jgi:DNA adenine methylase